MSKTYHYHAGKAIPQDARLKQVEKLASWMDARWTIPGTQMRIGLDPILGLIPGIGDTLGAAISAYIVHQAHQLGVPLHVKLRMVGNIIMDWLLGAIPLLGDIFDVGWKANLRNVSLLRQHLGKKQRSTGKDTP